MSCIITPSDLSGRSLPELFTLQHRLQLLLAHAQPGTANYRETVASPRPYAGRSGCGRL